MTAVTRFITAIDRMRISGAKKAIMRYLLLRPEYRIKAKEAKKMNWMTSTCLRIPDLITPGGSVHGERLNFEGFVLGCNEAKL